MKTLQELLQEKPCLFNSDIPDRVEEYLEQFRLPDTMQNVIKNALLDSIINSLTQHETDGCKITLKKDGAQE